MFIPKREVSRIKLTDALHAVTGTFTVGHEFKVTGITERGLDLEDDEGNTVYETGPFIKYVVID